MTLKLLRAEFPETPTPQPPRPWYHKLAAACRGVKFGIRGQGDFFVHFFSATLIFVSGFVLQFALVEWCVLIGAIGLVLTAEMFNRAIAELARSHGHGGELERHPVPQMGSGAVLIACVTALSMGGLVFGNRLWLMWHGK